jgi:hypothetical protein
MATKTNGSQHSKAVAEIQRKRAEPLSTPADNHRGTGVGLISDWFELYVSKTGGLTSITASQLMGKPFNNNR